MKIAIVGMGLSGSSILKTIIEHKKFSPLDQIYIFEDRATLGTGMPYEGDSEVKVLNSRADQVSMIWEKTEHFLEWYRANYDKRYKITDGMVSRVHYGEYIQGYFGNYFTHPQVKHIRERVVDISAMKQSGVVNYKIQTSSQAFDIAFDLVFLCIGHPDYQDPYALEASGDYIAMPYPLEQKLNRFEADDKIGIIGTGSAGVDCYRYLAKHYDFNNPFYFLARQNAFKLAEVYPEMPIYLSIDEKWISEKSAQYEGLIPLQTIIEAVEADFTNQGYSLQTIRKWANDASIHSQKYIVEHNPQDLSFIQNYFLKLASYMPVLYQRLPADDRQYFMQHYDPLLEKFLGPTPHETMKDIIDSYESSQVDIVFGLEAISIDPQGGFFVQAEQNFHLDKIINATGFDFNLENAVAKDPLLQNLYKKNLIMPASEGKFVLAKWPELQIMNPHDGYLENLIMTGLWVSSTHYRNNDLVQIMRYGASVADLAMDRQNP